MENTSKQIKERNTLGLINTYRSAIMGFAAIMVLLHHEWLAITPEGTILFQIENYIHYTGFLGVDIFLLLSGMGLYYAIQKHDIKTFYKRRFIRIVPAYLIVAIVIALIDDWSLGKFVCNITGINFYTKSTFSFLWYAIAMMQLYIVFPLYYKFFNKAKSKSRFTAIAILVWIIFVLVFVNLERTDLLTFTNRIPVFLIGILFGWMERNEKVQLNKFDWVLCFIVMIIGLFLEFVIILAGSWGILHAIGTGLPALLVCIPLVLILAKSFELMSTYLKRFSNVIIKPLTLLGTVSFEFYVVQEWIGKRVQSAACNAGYNNLIVNIVDHLAVCIACITLVYVCKPIIKLFSNENKK